MGVAFSVWRQLLLCQLCALLLLAQCERFPTSESRALSTREIPLRPNGTKVWESEALNQKMYERVAKSLAPWAGRKISFADLQSLTHGSKHNELAVIIDYKLYIEAAGLFVMYKSAGMYRQLSLALQWLREAGVLVPDCMFTFRIPAAPNYKTMTAAPSLALASSDQHVQVPYPNPYFLTHQKWAAQHRTLLQLAESRPFADRLPRAFYRGTCRGYPGSIARVELMAINSTLLDVGLTSNCDGSWNDAPGEAKQLLALGQPRINVRRVPLEKHGDFKYLVHMPGSASNSYSRHLQFALGMGGVVLKWDNPYFEFYYDWLEEGKHYVTVNASNILQTIEALNADPTRASRIAANAQAWFKEHLHPDFLQQYWWHLISQYATLLDFEPSLSLLQKPCACRAQDPTFNGKECPFCDNKLRYR